ncbi:hypothetical protein SAMN04488498_1082 [Mesorhizobium albiziae]|uniref:Oligosaccharide repeat unit polymerase n=2 Tax=Neomesorhizobium albiziae TaxID=335020 RepID=A0A1I4ADH7_9HYPH|nr:hypothetical protein GCM10007937_45130 [Mesorhizobium albiziae]SFK54485.1 hypothetical protein SAMN04488498_1082 [Mesorhizobium albiziae]
MVNRDPFRLWVSRNLQPIAFLGAYFATIVAGNVIFATPLGTASLKATGFSPRILDMDQMFTPGYWALLLCPFVLTPLVVYLTKRGAQPLIAKASAILPDFSGVEYLVFLSVCYAFVFYQFWQADVAALFLSGTDAVSSVNARFAIHDRIGYGTLMVLQALLPFLAIYSMLRWMRSGGRFWLVAMVGNIFMMSILLIMLNMKWPVLLFYIGLVMAVFVNAKRHAYVKAAIGTIFLVASFLMISSFVYRLAPETQADEPKIAAVEPTFAKTKVARASRIAAETSTQAFTHAPTILFAALNRMAVIYPYYYQTFTTEGAVCGGILEQAKPGPKCRASTFIYSRIFGVAEGYTDKGTSPQSVHISGYAMGGWPMALLALACGSFLVGLFACLPLDKNTSIGSLAVVGALAGYHLSQVPGEGVILFDHGLLWTFLMLGIFMAWRGVLRILGQSPATQMKPAE